MKSAPSAPFTLPLNDNRFEIRQVSAYPEFCIVVHIAKRRALENIRLSTSHVLKLQNDPFALRDYVYSKLDQ